MHGIDNGSEERLFCLELMLVRVPPHPSERPQVLCCTWPVLGAIGTAARSCVWWEAQPNEMFAELVRQGIFSGGCFAQDVGLQGKMSNAPAVVCPVVWPRLCILTETAW